ncbi:MAG: DUF502 domain-containing protein [Halobacteriales archaeon]
MRARIKSNLLGGLIVIAPLAVTAYVLLWIYGVVVDLPGTDVLRVTDSGVVNDLIQFSVSAVVLVVGLVAAGYAFRTASGAFVKKQIDDWARRVPFVGFVYNATQMAVEAMSMGRDEFDRPVKLDYAGVRFTGFKTGGRTDGGHEVIFVPTAPNITSGFVVEVEPERLKDSDESTEEALTRILSAGFASKDDDELVERMEEFGLGGDAERP